MELAQELVQWWPSVGVLPLRLCCHSVTQNVECHDKSTVQCWIRGSHGGDCSLWSSEL
jgi:hypothetical protein